MKTTRFPSWSDLRGSGSRLVALALAWPLVSLASAQGAASEKRMLAEFQAAFGSSEPAERAKAVTALGEGTRALEDKGSSKAVAKALAQGLADPDMDVATAAVWQFGRTGATGPALVCGIGRPGHFEAASIPAKR
jgi:hypothetical protein